MRNYEQYKTLSIFQLFYFKRYVSIKKEQKRYLIKQKTRFKASKISFNIILFICLK